MLRTAQDTRSGLPLNLKSVERSEFKKKNSYLLLHLHGYPYIIMLTLKEVSQKYVATSLVVISGIMGYGEVCDIPPQYQPCKRG